MSEIIKLAAFDMDGTITQHKTPLTHSCRDLLLKLSRSIRLVMVCAGSCERVYKQMKCFPVDICGHYGMQYSTVTDGIFSVIANDTVATDNVSVIADINAIRREFGLNEYIGDSVEFHDSGMFTFPILGTEAPLDKKLAYDPDRTKRRKYYSRVKNVFQKYNVYIGGSSSFDIVPKPYCKLYALKRYMKQYGVECSETIYFGDDYGPGGNDEDIYKSEIRFVEVDDYKEFPQKAESVLCELL